jgi:hypothetical protein
MRLGDLDDLKEKVALMWGDNNHITESMYEIIDNAPTVDLKDIYQEGYYNGHLEGYTKAINEERPQGEWLDYSEEYGYIECPFCRQATTCESNIDELQYCWNCGAHLQKGGAEE